jgi:hypothetical protein
MENLLASAYVENVDSIIDIFEKLEKEDKDKILEEEMQELTDEEAEKLIEDVLEGLWTIKPTEDIINDL